MVAVDLFLEGQLEKVAPENPYGIQPQLLYHQWRTAQALREFPLVMNVYNTGTGKTRASLLHLFNIPANRDNHVLVIAPTNELLHQHVTDIEEFVATYQLPFRVVEVNAALLRQLADPELAIVDRQGERLTRLVRNPLEFKGQLGISTDDNRTLPTIFVTNPDLFYYAFFWQFNASDQRNLFEEFISKFCYIVIDEFHYYNSKQLANFLFFMILSKELGYFEVRGRRICLLSATPDETTQRFLNSIFGEQGWVLLSPDNEPPEADSLKQVPILSPLHLRIQTGTLEEFATAEAKTIKQWLDQGQDGALISSALWRVNSAYAALRGKIDNTLMGRITGAQPTEERRQDQHKRLILATPTVDIGYNFLKADKTRQNLDFVCFDARFRDEFVQRLGRTGRVLGKDETEIPSHAVALLDDEAVSRFTAIQGQRLNRTELRNFLEEQAAIPIKDDFVAYIRSGGLLENAYPFYRLSPMFAKEEQPRLEELFEAVRRIFAPQSNLPYRSVIGCYKRADAINTWLREGQYDKKLLGQVMAEYLGWAIQEIVTEEDAGEVFPLLEEQEMIDVRKGFRLYCEMKQALQRAQFNFRDSFNGPVATVYDPERHLSGAITTDYDLLHIVQNYGYRPITSDFYHSKIGEWPAKDAICVQIEGLRQPRQKITLTWRNLPKLGQRRWDQAIFARCFVNGEPIAIKGLIINADEPLPDELRGAIAEQYVPALLIPSKNRGRLQRALAQRPVYPRKLTVQIGHEQLDFEVILGTNALLMSPLLWWIFQLDRRKEETAIIC
jgi:CRISPR-associated endonuclease/helicase Cas3